MEAASVAVLLFPQDMDGVARVFGSHLYGKIPEKSQSLFLLSSLPLLPWLSASCSFLQDGPSNMMLEGSTNRLSHISMAFEVPYL